MLKFFRVSLSASMGTLGLLLIASNFSMSAGNSLPFPCAQESRDGFTEVPWVEIVRSSNTLKFWCGKRVVRQFSVATGKPGWETPLGVHQVLYQVRDPTFQNPFTGRKIPSGPNNPLGARSIGFRFNPKYNSYEAIHGTHAGGEKLVSSGSYASHGCVRMLNEDVILIYDWILHWRSESRQPLIIWVRETAFQLPEN